MDRWHRPPSHSRTVPIHHSRVCVSLNQIDNTWERKGSSCFHFLYNRVFCARTSSRPSPYGRYLNGRWDNRRAPVFFLLSISGIAVFDGKSREKKIVDIVRRATYQRGYILHLADYTWIFQTDENIGRYCKSIFLNIRLIQCDVR